MEGAMSIGKASVISSKEHRHSKRRTGAGAMFFRCREDSFKHLKRPSRIVATVPSNNHIDLITLKQMKSNQNLLDSESEMYKNDEKKAGHYFL